MRTRRIRVVPYDPGWPDAFSRIAGRALAAIRKAGVPAKAHHVGSTSVPGLAAKPIIDIDIEIPDMGSFPGTVSALSAIGYRHEGDLGIPFREAFAYEGTESLPEHNLYVCPAGGAELSRHIAFRSWLRSHPEDARAYERAKLRAAEICPEDIDGYIREKSGVVEAIYARIRAGIPDMNKEGYELMTRQAAFVSNSRMLKGALHCHTTRSDGAGAPEDVMRLHKQHDYDFMAITDHRRYNYESFAPETGILVVPGMEMDANLPDEGVHCFHEVVIGPSREDGNAYQQDQRFESVRVNSQEEFQSALDRYHADGNMTLYCHPQWSGTPAREFELLKGNFAMELWNSGCAIENEQDTDNGAIWDELLMKGVKLWGVATDDGHKMNQHCNGWVMVNAEKNLNAILAALKDGAFYASTGPEIYDFRIEDDEAIVECSPCASVAFHYGRQPLKRTIGEDGAFVTEGRTRLRPFMTYVRATVVDTLGRRAWTNPIFLK